MATNGAGISDSPKPGSKRVQLNVGGNRFTTTVQTLQREPESMLARLVSDDWFSKSSGSDNQESEEIFIDRNGRNFHVILDYLRHGSSGAYVPADVHILNELLREAEFYQLLGLLRLVREKLHLPNRTIKRGEIIRWREDAIAYYWRPFAVTIATEGIEFAFLYDKIGRKYNDKQTVATCIGCGGKMFVDQITVFDYKVHFDEWEALKHHMQFMRGIVAECINETCCIVQWNNGKQLHVPITAIMPAD